METVEPKKSPRPKEADDGEKNLPQSSARRESVFDPRKKSHSVKKFERLVEYVREHVIGQDAVFGGPFGPRPVISCEFTSSGRPLQFIEDYMRCHVYPTYGHAQATTCITSLQLAAFRESARDTTKKCFNCSEDDVVYFVGGGATGALHKLTHILKFKPKHQTDNNMVVLLSPFEHSMNIQTWQESEVKVERVRQNEDGCLDTDHLIEMLKTYKKKKYHTVASFTAVSHVTGVAADVAKISRILHEHGALSVWDCTAAIPNKGIDMNAIDGGYLDAAFCSSDILLGGGTGASGILIIKRKFVRNPDPGNCAVSPETYRVDDDKGELGMSTIMESIRTGLVLQLKEAIGTEMIQSKNKEICQRAMDRWRHNPYLLQLGPKSQKTIPMFSFLVIHPESKTFLHHNFVAILLNDLYGIQAYGGCGNAGPYMEDLLEIDDELSRKLNKKLTEEKIRTGCTSVYISYVLPNHTVDFVLGAVDQVAKHGWKLLPLYEYNTSLGVWKHRHFQFSLDSLKDIRYKLGGMKVNNNSISQHFRAGKETLREILAETSSIFEEAYLICKNSDAEGDPKLDIEEEQRDLIWFLQPSQALRMLKSKTPRQPIKLEELVDFVFFPRTFVSDEEENAIRASFVTSPGNDSGNAGTDSDTTSDSLTDEEEEDEERPRSNYKPVMTSFLESRLRQNSARAPDSPVETRDVAPPDDTQESKNSKTKKPVIKPKNYKKHVQRMLSYGYLTRYNVRKEYNSSPEVMNSFTRLPPINKQDKRTNISKS